MKKTLLLLVAGLATMVGANAQSVSAFGSVADAAETQQKAPSRAATENGYNIQFCGNLYTWYRTTAADLATYQIYIKITPELATRMAGNTVTDLSFSTVLRSNNNATHQGYIFISEDIDANPIVSTPFTFENMQNAKPNYQTAAFSEPYTIKEGQAFYVGYVVEDCRPEDYPIGADNTTDTQFAGYARTFVDGKLETETFIGENKVNTYMIIHTQGEHKSIENFLTVNSLKFPTTVKFTLPSTPVGTEYKVTASLSNLGDNAIRTFGYYYEVNGVPTDRYEYKSTALSSRRNYTKTLNAFTVGEGRNKVVLHITDINDEPVDLTSEIGCYGFPEGEMGYPRNILVEKATGTWCGYCPEGIMGFAEIEKMYPETFIPIDVHTGDEFSVASYVPVAVKFSTVPGSIVNRDPKSMPYPNASTLSTAIDSWVAQPCPAAIAIESATLAEDVIWVTTSSRFKFAETDANYAIAFSIAENGLKGFQQNYLSGKSDSEWGKYPSVVEWTYSHTARDLFTYEGISGSVPTAIEASKEYSFTFPVSLQNIVDPMQTYIVAMLMDVQSGCVLNSAKVEASQYAGVDVVTVDHSLDLNDPVEYFDLQGRRVAQPTHGIFIRRQGTHVTKQVLR